MHKNHLKIPSAVTAQFGIFFSFVFFNTILVAMRGVLIAIAFLSIYYTCIGIQKALLKI